MLKSRDLNTSKGASPLRMNFEEAYRGRLHKFVPTSMGSSWARYHLVTDNDACTMQAIRTLNLYLLNS